MLIAAIVFLIGTFTAMIMYDNYGFLNQFFSDLGNRGDTFNPEIPSDIRPKSTYPEIFNVTLWVSAVFIIPFFPYAGRKMQIGGEPTRGRRFLTAYVSVVTTLFIVFRINEWFQVPDIVATGIGFLLLGEFILIAVFGFMNREEMVNGLFSAIGILGLQVGPWLAMVGVLDLKTSWYGHVYVAINLYFVIAFLSLYWLIAVSAAPSDHPYKRSLLWLLDVLFVIVIITCVYINVIGELALAELPVFNLLKMPAYQKIMAYSFISYFGFVVSRRLKAI